MGEQDLLEGVVRIWTEDRLALFLAGVLLFVQIAILLFGFWRTIAAVRGAASAIEQTAVALAERGFSMSQIERARLPEARRALHAVRDLVDRGEELDGEEIAEVLAPNRLLPGSYNARWDAAAPGVFTAIGILGTFLGLILGFLRVNPSDASNSVGPLLGGMVVAFGNSFVGVLFSVLWTYSSRTTRHRFDAACKALLQAVVNQLSHTSLGQRSVAYLKRVDAGIASLAAAISQLAKNTQESSERLLANLSKNVGDSFESLVNKPFEQVNASIERFNSLVTSAATVHEALIARLESTARHIDEGGARLSHMFETAHECVEEFATATLELREASSAAATVVAQTHDAAIQMHSAADAIGVSAVRVVQVAKVMEDATTAMTTTAVAMSENARSFERSTERLERSSGDLQGAVGSLRDATHQVAHDTTKVISAELGRAIAAMSASLSETGERTISSFEDSANRVVESVSENMTDLTERLTANLGTLGSQISENSDSMNQVIGDIKRQVEFAARTNRESLDQLAKTTPEVIKAQLSEFDRALAKAVDHFSGTLEQWDGKLATIEEFSGELRKLTNKDIARLHRVAANDNGAADANGASP